MNVLAANAASSGPLAFLIVVLLGVVTFLLIRNMNSRLRRLPRSFPETPPPPDGDEPEAPRRR